MSTVEILRKAKAEIERRGWYQGGYGAPGDPATCPVCLEGAVQAAITGDPFAFLRGEQLGVREALELLWSASGLESTAASVGDDWNDAEGRTVEEVYALLDSAIALAEAEEVTP